MIVGLFKVLEWHQFYFNVRYNIKFKVQRDDTYFYK